MKHKIILASNSPRRQQMLRQTGINFEVRIPEVEEYFPPHLNTSKVPEFIARLKAGEMRQDLGEDELIIAADTVVCLNNRIFGKPKDEYEAAATLRELSGKKHAVITGVYLLSQEKEISFSVTTEVYFLPLNEQEIHYYIENYKPFDKAGSYGIQEWIGMSFIEKINGCYFNVVGLPVSRLLKELKTF